MSAEPTSIHSSEPTHKLRRLVKRREFLRASRGARAGKPALSLQAIKSADETSLPGIGFTVTRKVGNAPERNRVKRRLRAAARACAGRFQPQYDYVLVGRRAALSEPFVGIVGSLETLIARVHANQQRAQADVKA